jgi:Skp family chaperone for outer membrane proteins
MAETLQDYKEEVKIPVAIELAKWHAMSIEAEGLANFITITDDIEDELATGSLSKVKQFRKTVDEAQATHLAPFKTYQERIKGMFSPIADSLAKAEKTIKDKIIAYRNDKARTIEEEAQRVALERKRQLEEAQKKAELEGRDATKEELKLPPPPPVQKAQNTVKSGAASSTIRKTWKAKIVDPKAVIDAISAGRVPISVVEFSMVYFNQMARASKKAQTVDGVEYFEDQTLAGS